jgi:hypothetical protein
MKEILALMSALSLGVVVIEQVCVVLKKFNLIKSLEKIIEDLGYHRY